MNVSNNVLRKSGQVDHTHTHQCDYMYQCKTVNEIPIDTLNTATGDRHSPPYDSKRSKSAGNYHKIQSNGIFFFLLCCHLILRSHIQQSIENDFEQNS